MQENNDHFGRSKMGYTGYLLIRPRTCIMTMEKSRFGAYPVE